MFKRVLLCYDGSERGCRALKQGAELAISMRAEISILAVVPTSLDSAMHLSRSTGGAGFDSEMEHRRLLDEAVAWLKARGVGAAAHLVHGDVINVILQYAKRLKIDLIVVGQYPKAGPSRWWTNSKRASLSEHSPCSIFISIGG